MKSLLRILTLCTVLSLLHFHIQAQDFKWLHSPGEALYQEPIISTDGAGNVYVGGSFKDGDTFGSSTLHTPNTTGPYLAKYDRKGNVRWALSLAKKHFFSIRDIAATASGDVYLLGAFTDTVEINNQLLISSNYIDGAYGEADYFLAKLNRKGKGFMWVKQFNGYPNDIDTDEAGNVYISGIFRKQMKLEGAVLADTSDITSYTFLARYSANGKFSWLKKSLSIPRGFEIPRLSVSANGLSTLSWANNDLLLYFDDKTGSRPQDKSGFEKGSYIARFSSKGNCLWVKNIYRSLGNLHVQHAMITDQYGRIYVTGYFSGSLVIGNDTLKSGLIPAYTDGFGYLHPESYRNEMFIAKFNRHGSKIWIRKGVSTGLFDERPLWGADLALSQDGSIWHSGSFYDTLGIGSLSVTGSSSILNLYIAHYSPAGAVDWISKAEGFSNGYSSASLAADRKGNCYISGQCDPGASFGSLNSSGLQHNNPFLVRIQHLAAVNNIREMQPAIAAADRSIETPLHINAYPNPFSEKVTLSFQSERSCQVHLILTDLTGRTILQRSQSVPAGSSQAILDQSNLPKGAYLLKIQSEGYSTYSKLIKQ